MTSDGSPAAPAGRPTGDGLVPARRLSAFDVALITVGIVVGVGIFRAPAEVAAGAGSPAAFIGLWIAGGVAALAGALCYAELATRHPSIGGEYHFLRLAFGRGTGFLFVWARMAVIQTGTIASIAFVFADYAQALLPLPGPGPALWAGLSVIVFTLLNLAGLTASRSVQLVLEGLALAAVAAVIVAGLLIEPGAAAVAPAASDGAAAGQGLGLALVFVLLTYGGWNEAAYLSAEVRGGARSMVRALVGGVALVAGLYIAINLAYLHALGLEGLRATPTPAADIARALGGEAAAAVLALAIIIASLSTLNVTILTGGRAVCALGRELPALRRLGDWDDARSTPAAALLIQGAVSLALVAYGATARDGFAAMVAFGSPVFWLFLLLTGLSLFVLRRRSTGPTPSGAFSVPLYPFVPILFCATCAYMLWSSIGYASFLFGQGGDARLAGWLGLVLLGLGLPLALWARRAHGAGAT